MFSPAVTNALIVLGKGKITLDFLAVSNPTTADVFIQMFDVEAASEVTLGTTIPKFSIHVPVGASGTASGSFHQSLNPPLQFNQGLWIAATTAPTNSTAPSTACPVNYAFRS